MNNIDKKFAILKKVIKKFKDEVNSTQNSTRHQYLQSDKRQKINMKKRNYFKFTPKELSYYNQIGEKERSAANFINGTKNYSCESSNLNTNYFLFDSNKNKKSKAYNYSNCKYQNKMRTSINEYNMKYNSNGLSNYKFNDPKKYCLLKRDNFFKESSEIMCHYRAKTKESINEKPYKNLTQRVLLNNKSQMLPNFRENISNFSAIKKQMSTDNDYFSNNDYYLNNNFSGFYSTRRGRNERKERNLENKKIQDIIKSTYADEIIEKAGYFDEYGKNSYNKYKKNLSYRKRFFDENCNLKAFKNYIVKEINGGKNINKEINLYKKLCKQQIEITDKSKLKEIIGDVEDIYIRDKEDEYMLDNLIDTFNFNIGK